MMRQRERFLVQIGAALLALGFALQAAAQVFALDSSRAEVGAAATALALLAVSVVVGLRSANRGAPRYATFPEGDDRLEDQRDVFQVATVDDWWNLLAPFVRHTRGVAIGEVDEGSPAHVNHGRWMTTCPRCDGTPMAWPENPQAICAECGTLFRVEFPPAATRQAVERLLLRRAKENRNWLPTESVDDLRAENRAHGLADDR